MTEEDRKLHKPKVRELKLRIKVTARMCDFVKKGGIFEDYSRKMFFHSTHVLLLGTKFCGRMVYKLASEIDGTLVLELDYSEKYQPVPMREIQSEHFGKDASLSIEIAIATYTAWFEGKDKPASRKTISYGHLSDQKIQVAATTNANLYNLLDDIFAEDNLTMEDLEIIFDIVDGCSAQYKCGTALYLLACFAARHQKIY